MPQTVPDHATYVIYLTIHSALNVQFKSNRAYCKTFVANMPMVENTMFAHFSNNQFQSFKTDIVQVDNNNPVWNAKYEIRINGPKVEVLSILVKTKQLLCCAIVGVCIINLKILIDAGHVDQWFALRKGQFQTDHLRLQMLLKKIEQPSISLRYKTDNSPEFVSTTIDKLTCGQSLNDDYCQRHEGKRDPCDQKHLERKQTSCHENDEYRQQMMKDKVSSRSSKPHESDNEAEIFDEELGFEVDQEGGNNKESAEQKPRSEGSEDLNSQRSHTSYKSINSNQLSCKQINGTHTAQQARSPSSEVLCGMKQSTVENLLAESRQVDQDFTHDKRLESSARIRQKLFQKGSSVAPSKKLKLISVMNLQQLMIKFHQPRD
ncbi:Hypothetical protein PHPALM_6163 [Phytophthora palmivora]|uniref:C2 domain-containing protein n=1 Tax=Phytophthora palmivora TaxID=4796 RepID=A0A2P4YFJ1_9STRA|nr:Hypothetical protein PHPALM_6163 [Phytophthora palmivora]